MKNSLALKLGGLLAVSAVCLAASGGCGTQLHKASLAAGSIAASLNTAATINHNDTLETPAEKATVAAYILSAATANNAFIGDIAAAESAGGTTVTARIVTDFNAMLASVDALQAGGVLGIKSPQAQADFTAVTTAIQAQIVILEAIVGTTPAATPTSMLHRVAPVAAAGGLIGAAGIAFTPAEIDELIALATAAASELLPKLLALKGETDAQILTAAQADDAAAIKTAEGDTGAAPVPAEPEAVPETAEDAAEEPEPAD